VDAPYAAVEDLRPGNVKMRFGGSGQRSGGVRGAGTSLVRARLFWDGKKMSWMGGPARGRAPAGDDSGCGYAQHGYGTRAGGPSRVPRQNVARGDTRVSKHDERATCEVASDTVRLHFTCDRFDRTHNGTSDRLFSEIITALARSSTAPPRSRTSHPQPSRASSPPCTSS
jgi:hypothetical protein